MVEDTVGQTRAWTIGVVGRGVTWSAGRSPSAPVPYRRILGAGACFARLNLKLTRVLLLALFGVLDGCAQLQPRPSLPSETALPPGDQSLLDQAAQVREEEHTGQSAFRLVVEGTEAFLIRMQMARLASRSLDVQVYIWHADLTGAFFAQQLLDAADRGVKVRLLVDDMDARSNNAGFAALAAHPNIEVRLFNPFASRRGSLQKLGEAITSFGRINRRMHNKIWIADNRIAISGGRNVGDEYFGASDEKNFVDLDFAMMGPVVREASHSFDQYWNSPPAYPIEVLDHASVTKAALDALRESLAAQTEAAGDSRYAVALRSDDALSKLMADERSMEWSANYRFVSDDPLKVTMKKRDAKRSNVGVTLIPMLSAATIEVDILSPYFVPSEKVTAAFGVAAESGRDVRILTNSLAATDVAAVHGGYSRHRKKLLAKGVQLWELKPSPIAAQPSTTGSSGASLHSKAFVVDHQRLFVGSFNLDQRSTWLNCEQGVLTENAALAARLEEMFATQIGGDRAWQVRLNDGKLSWTDGKVVFFSEPKASAGQFFKAWLARLLHIDAQL
jgi:putative cardiolipin synthase